MTEPSGKRRKLSHEVLGLFAVCFVISLLVFAFLTVLGIAVVENYCAAREILPDEEQRYHLDRVIFGMSLAASVGFFSLLFLILFGERFSYVHRLMQGIEALQSGEYEGRVPLEGNNELTQLAEAINYLCETEQRVREQEKRLTADREELIRSLSHDIRTPLTAILSASELMAGGQIDLATQGAHYAALIREKAEQIRRLTDVLLDGGQRSLTEFADARLLMEQLADDFASALEERFRVACDLSECAPFSGRFDVGELRRILDNLISNVEKYADEREAVKLTIRAGAEGVVLTQQNTVRPTERPTESHRMGLQSIRRIAQQYGGEVRVREEEGQFEILITLSEIR